MSNVMFAVKQTTTNVLATVSSSANAVSLTADSLANLAGTAAALSGDYRSSTERDIAENATHRHNRRMRTRALDDAQFYLSLEDELKNNPRLQALYEQTMADYKTADDAVTAKLSAVS